MISYRRNLLHGKIRPAVSLILMVICFVSQSNAFALELLAPRADDEVVRNIIYYGMPNVLKCVADGTFRERGTKK